MEWSKYRLVLTGMRLAKLGQRCAIALVEKWVAGTGAKNVISGVIHCERAFHMDTMTYSCYFDSSHWTGRGGDFS